MNEKVHIYLQQLINQEVKAIGRVSNMLWIGLGKDIEMLDWKGRKVIKSTIAIHVQSTWRIVNKEKDEILLASSDFYAPNSKTTDENFEWDIQGNNLFDEKAKFWLEKVKGIRVRNYRLSCWGDLLLLFSNGDRMEIFVNSSDDTENWRFLKCGSDEEHMVVTGAGIEFV